MFKAWRAAAALVSIMSAMTLTNCVRIPVADDLGKGPQVDEIVRRVKCDLYEAFADRLNAPAGYEWLHGWTVQANLNLIVNDQSILSPGATITQPLTAVTIPGKVSNFGQSFSFGVGASWTNTTTRNESITFTVSMTELMKQFGGPHSDCNFPNTMDLRSELGLKQWVSAALTPVDVGDLRVGYHKAPKTGGSTTMVAAALKDLQPALKGALIGTVPKGSYDCDNPDSLPPRSSGPPSAATLQSDIVYLSCDYSHIANKKEFDFSKLNGNQVSFIAQTITDFQRAIADLQCLNTPDAAKVIAALERTALALAVFVDPPIDVMSHQVQFIIVWNANASPSWTLVNFKGPNPASGSLFSATKTQTHTLNITIGPTSSPDATNALSALQIGTAVGNALTAGGVTVP